MCSIYELMKIKGYSGPENILELQDWLSKEKKIFIETQLRWKEDEILPVGYSARIWIQPYEACFITNTMTTPQDAIEIALIRMFDYF